MDQTPIRPMSPLFAQRVIWAAFLTSIVQYDIVAYLDVLGSGRRLATEDAPLPLFLAMGFCYLLYFLIPRFFPERDMGIVTDAMRRQDLIRLLLQVAAANVAPMIGLIVAFSDGVLRPLWISSAVSFLLVAVLFPKKTSSF